MKNTIIDAGPLIALFDGKDLYHDKIIKFLSKNNVRLITTWPVITETCHMLSFSIKAQIDFLKWCERGALKIENIDYSDLERIITLTEKYSNIPMDLADASLVVLSEKLGIDDIITIDSDYYIYRTMKKEMLRNIFE
jgi:uncharacterized protein